MAPASEYAYYVAASEVWIVIANIAVTIEIAGNEAVTTKASSQPLK